MGGVGGGGGPSSPVGALRITKPVSQWAVEDTTSWLAAIGLDQYAGAFRQNEISGDILLEVGLDDLDYMSIRVLAHRKLLLKGIEDLKQNGRPTLDLKAPANSPTRLSVGANGVPRYGPLSQSGGEPLHPPRVEGHKEGANAAALPA